MVVAGNREVARCGEVEVTFRGSRSTLCSLEVLFGGAGIAKLLGRAA